MIDSKRLMSASVVILSLSGSGHAEPPAPSKVRSVIRAANRAFERGDFEEAAHVYASLPPTPDRPAEVCYNEGLTHAALGDVERAKQSFRMADLNASTNELRANARFNLGRLAFDDAMSHAQEDPKLAMEGLRNASRIYRAVLEVRPEDAEAAKNVERCRLAIRAIEERLQKQAEEQARQSERMQEMAQRLKELAERQEQASERSREAQEQMEQDSSIGSEASRQSREQQEGLSEETREMLSKLMQELGQMPGESPGQTEMSEAMAEIERAMEEQSGAERSLERSLPGRAVPQQQDAAERLEAAAERLAAGAGEGQGEGKQPGESEERGGNAPDGQEDQSEGEQSEELPSRPREVDRLGDQDGDPIARRYLEKEIRDRANRIRRGPPLPTDKDW